MRSLRLAERKLFTTVHGKLEPSPVAALHSWFPLTCGLQDEALYHHSPHRWNIWETQDVSLCNYHVRNLPHIPNIPWELIKLSSGVWVFFSALSRTLTLFTAWRYKMLDFKILTYWGNVLHREHTAQFGLCLEKKYRFITMRKDVQEYPEKSAGIPAKGRDEVGTTVESWQAELTDSDRMNWKLPKPELH